jgi:hypothetical protein
MRKKVIMICFEVLSKHLLDGLPEYEALHICMNLLWKNYINMSANVEDTATSNLRMFVKILHV